MSIHVNQWGRKSRDQSHRDTIGLKGKIENPVRKNIRTYRGRKDELQFTITQNLQTGNGVKEKSNIGKKEVLVEIRTLRNPTTDNSNVKTDFRVIYQ